MTGTGLPISGLLGGLNITDLYHRIELFIFLFIILLLFFFIFFIFLIIFHVFLVLGGDLFFSSYVKRIIIIVGIPVDISDCSNLGIFTKWLTNLSSTVSNCTLIISCLLVCKTNAY